MTHEQTPAHRAGFRVGDRAVVVSEEPGGSFQPGAVISLYQDDGSSKPLWKLEGGPPKSFPGPLLGLGIGKIGGYFALAHVQKLAIPHYTPKPGDYISTAGLTESEYHQVAALFMAAGAGRGEHPDHIEYREQPKFGYSTDGCLFHGHGGALLVGAELILHDGRLVPVAQTETVKPRDLFGDTHNSTQEQIANLRRRVEKLESSGTEPPDKEDARPGGFYDIRPSGFYWVKRGRWVVAEWDAGSQTWDLLGYTHSPFVADEALDTIGPRIHPPED